MRIVAPLTAGPLQPPLIRPPKGAVPAVPAHATVPANIEQSVQVAPARNPGQVGPYLSPASDQSHGKNPFQSQLSRDRAVHQKLKGSYAKRLEESARMLRENLLGKQPSLEDVLALVNGEPAMAMAALQTAAKQANAEGHPAEHAALSVWAKELGIKHGSTRRSDIIALRPSTYSGANRRRRIDTRPLYSDAAAVMESVKGLIESLMRGQEKSEHFQLKLQQMQSTITHDFAAMAPTASQKQMRKIVRAGNVVRHVAVLLEGCKKILKRMSSKNPLAITEPVNFLQSLLRLSADGLQIKDTQDLAQVIGGEHLKHQLAFLNALRPMVQELPLVLWRDLDKRRLALNNLRALMTQLTEQEQIQNLGRIAP